MLTSFRPLVVVIVLAGAVGSSASCAPASAPDADVSAASSLTRRYEVEEIDPAFVASWTVRVGDKANFAALNLRADGTYTRTNVDEEAPESGQWRVITHEWDWVFDQTLVLRSSGGNVSFYGANVPEWANWAVFYQDELTSRVFDLDRHPVE